MVAELKGVGKSALNARERRTNSAAAYPPGVMLIPLNRMVIALSICLLKTCSGCGVEVGESCSVNTAFLRAGSLNAELLTVFKAGHVILQCVGLGSRVICGCLRLLNRLIPTVQ